MSLEEQWEAFEERVEELTSALEEIEEAVAEAEIDIEALSATNDDLQSELDDLTDRADALEERLTELEENHVQECLDGIKEDGLYVSDRWRIFEASNSDLLVRDTSSDGNPSYRFVAGGRDTFGDE